MEGKIWFAGGPGTGFCARQVRLPNVSPEVGIKVSEPQLALVDTGIRNILLRVAVSINGQHT